MEDPDGDVVLKMVVKLQMELANVQANYHSLILRLASHRGDLSTFPFTSSELRIQRAEWARVAKMLDQVGLDE